MLTVRMNLLGCVFHAVELLLSPKNKVIGVWTKEAAAHFIAR